MPEPSPILPAFDACGDGPAVLLMHGFPLNRRMWTPQIAPLVSAGYRVILPDLPGFGATPPLPRPIRISDYGESIIQLLDALQIGRAVVGGMSMGGYVLFDLLARYPERIAAAIFVVTRAEADDPAGVQRRHEMAETVRRDGIKPIADIFAPLLLTSATLAGAPELVSRVRKLMESTSPAGAAAALLAMAERPDRTQTLATLTLPALAIGAELDRAIPPVHSRTIATTIPDGRFCLIPDSGHLANLEAPQHFNACLLDFLDRLPAEGC